MKIVSHETHLCRDTCQIVRIQHKLQSFIFQATDSKLAQVLQTRDSSPVFVDHCGSFNLMGFYCHASQSPSRRPCVCLYVEENQTDNTDHTASDNKVVATCWNEGTRVVLRSYSVWQSQGLDACVGHMISVLPWNLWTQSEMPSILCGISNGSYDMPFTDTQPGDKISDCIDRICIQFKKRNAKVINVIGKSLAKLESDNHAALTVPDEVCLVGLMRAHPIPGNSGSSNACRILLLNDLSVITIPTPKFKNLCLLLQETSDFPKLYLKTLSSSGHHQLPGILVDTNSQYSTAHRALDVKTPLPLVLWQLPLDNVLAVQGVNLSDILQPIPIRPAPVHTATRTQPKPHMFQDLMRTHHLQASEQRKSCSPVADTTMSAHLAAMSTLINVSIV